ncbi:phospho-N-acetylmuramoyl-pentapeptide-transferase [Proteiniclasticum ruminis]|uniref:phospho-N-acetylmuramoyl-pentapeptide- transferase n=1 Tax=Proteiniclasticum ruminis TaxID=398199 RepID=UPI0028A911C1|nr:phospho-N-acetylmuramoyl-pentapeptide-transferase [Proteiniclasticum ruminis]
MEISVISLFVSMAAGIAMGPYVIRKLKAFKFGQNIRKEGPESHLVKQGIPSMGGVLFLSVLLIVGLLFSKVNATVVFMIVVTLSFGLIGFMDDYLKVKKKSSDGLSAKSKMAYLLLFGILVGCVLHFGFDYDAVRIPFVNNEVSLGIFYVLFVVVFFAAVTNAVNLTDGIDGLSSTVTICVLIFYVLVGMKQEQEQVVLFSSVLIGGLLSFLIYNRYPAKVFMGDTGSLALGGAVGVAALMTKTEILLILVGIVYVVETLSVIIQVAVFKKTGKRVFKMAPIHHHFEALGWKENKIVVVFASVTLLAVVAAYLVL